jgi:hypothetical protein
VVALVQTAAAAPVVLLALPAGVLGGFFNRRTLLIVVQTARSLPMAAGEDDGDTGEAPCSS